MKISRIPFFIALTMISLLGRSVAEAAVSEPSRLADSANRFGFRLLGQLSADNLAGGKAADNLFLSPPGIAWAFDMLFNGADGPTLQSMASTLEVQGWSLADLNAANLALTKSLTQADPQVQISIANGLFGKPGLRFLSAFLDSVRSYYSAELAPLESADTVNAWVKAKTQGKIPSILRPENITPQTILVLVNALYFKGIWEKPFPKTATQARPFHRLDGKTLELPMMSRSGSFRYFEGADIQAIRLPYGSGRLGMLLLLPKAPSDLKSLVGGLDEVRWKKIVAGMVQRPGKIVLPRFRVEYSAELSHVLQAMGMRLPFTDQADFKKIAEVPPGWWIKISAVFHKTFVEVNEEGTEAAAATAITMLAGSAAPPPVEPFTMVLDRPFFAAIEDSSTGLLLFIGTIVSPQ